MTIPALSMNSADSSGYRITREKKECLATILKDISVLISDPIQRPVTLETGNTVIPRLGLTNEAAQLTDYITSLQQGIFNISVLGAFNVGKSTLLNALLGAKVFPAYPLPTTAIMTYLVYGERNDVMICEEAKQRPYSISWEVFTQHFILSKAEVDSIDTQGRIISRLKSIKYAWIESQNPFLANGIRLIDTPGLGASVDHTSMIGQFLQQPETALLFVLNATNPFPEEVMEFLARALRSQRHENVFFVINRIDQIKPAAVDTLKQHIRHSLRRFFLAGDDTFDHNLYLRRVFFLSAKNALETRIVDCKENTEASGLPALERGIEQFLTSNKRFSQALNPLLQSLQRIVDKACQGISREKVALEEAGKLKANFSAVKDARWLAVIESKLLELLKIANMVATIQNPAFQSSDQTGAPPAISPQCFSSKQSEQFSTPSISGRRTKKLQLEETDLLGVSSRFNEDLQFVEQIAERYDFTFHERAELRKAIEQIRDRCNDPNLYMAVVGEFSSGKSTFINALLRQKLLKASVLPTTATAVRFHYGARLDVSVLFENQDKPLSYLETSAQLWECLHAFYPLQQGKDGDMHEFIRLVTTEDSVASRIKDLVISHPASFLKDGIVIIDTPGTNALSKHHAQITYQLIQQEADVAVVIIPGPLLSQTLKTFITDHLRPFLHRSLFIVTQMDKIPEEEQEQVIEYLYHSLTNDLGIHQPIVLYQAAAQIALNALGEQRKVRPEMEYWKDQFLALEYALWHRLYRERLLSITERLLRLMTRLFEQLDKHLRARQALYETRQIDLELRLNTYKTHLQSATESTIGRHFHELLNLSQLQNGIRSDLLDIERRREILHQGQVQLATRSI